MADLLPISERLYDLSILLVFRFDDTYEHDVLLNHHIPVEEARQQSELLFQVISERSERASLIISTNLELSKWVQFFGDPMLTAALVDRVTHRAHILNMNGESYRLKEGRARQVKVDQS